MIIAVVFALVCGIATYKVTKSSSGNSSDNDNAKFLKTERVTIGVLTQPKSSGN